MVWSHDPLQIAYKEHLTALFISATLELDMATYSTRFAAKKLGMDAATLSRYIRDGKIPPPKTLEVGGLRIHSWTDADLERVREILPKIANGRKTRHQKQAKKQTTRKPKR